MADWQVAYHSTVFLIALSLFGWQRRKRGAQVGCLAMLTPLLLATAAEWCLHTFIWPDMLASDPQAGIGLLLAWILNVVIGGAAGLLVFSIPAK
jgi:hypothetical protein